MGGPEDAPQRGVGDLLDLPEQVKDLLAVPDEVAGGQPRRQEHVLEGLALRPLEDGGDEPEVELPAQLDLMRILAPAHGHPELGERLPSPPKGLGGEVDPPGHPFPGFVDQRGDQRGVFQQRHTLIRQRRNDAAECLREHHLAHHGRGEQ